MGRGAGPDPTIPARAFVTICEKSPTAATEETWLNGMTRWRP